MVCEAVYVSKTNVCQSLCVSLPLLLAVKVLSGWSWAARVGFGFLACGHMEGSEFPGAGHHGWEHLWNMLLETCKLEHLGCPWLTMESLWWNCSRNKWRPRILGDSGSCFGRAWHFYSWWFTVGRNGGKFFPSSSPAFLQEKAQLYSRKWLNQLLYLVWDALHCSFTAFSSFMLSTIR